MLYLIKTSYKSSPSVTIPGGWITQTGQEVLFSIKEYTSFVKGDLNDAMNDYTGWILVMSYTCNVV